MMWRRRTTTWWQGPEARRTVKGYCRKYSKRRVLQKLQASGSRSKSSRRQETALGPCLGDILESQCFPQARLPKECWRHSWPIRPHIYPKISKKHMMKVDLWSWSKFQEPKKTVGSEFWHLKRFDKHFFWLTMQLRHTTSSKMDPVYRWPSGPTALRTSSTFSAKRSKLPFPQHQSCHRKRIHWRNDQPLYPNRCSTR